jgi:hypothetical protein
VVDPQGDDTIHDGVAVTGLVLHPLAPDRWILEVEGARLEAGRAVAPFRSAWIRTSPLELVERCAATVGPARASHLGVSTPGLAFDGLRLG